MTRPHPKPIDPTRLVELAQGVIAADRFPDLATVDSAGEAAQPRVRPVSPVRTDGFTVYVANLRQYNKTKEIADNPQVELCYMDESHNQVRVTAKAEVVKDKQLIQEIWDANPLMRQFLGTPDNPELVIYRLMPQRVRYMQEWALEYYEVPLS